MNFDLFLSFKMKSTIASPSLFYGNKKLPENQLFTKEFKCARRDYLRRPAAR
jgi:hypothetical protein